eukprot:354691-Chlamydomonas_euryale.AAC.14
MSAADVRFAAMPSPPAGYRHPGHLQQPRCASLPPPRAGRRRHPSALQQPAAFHRRRHRRCDGDVLRGARRDAQPQRCVGGQSRWAPQPRMRTPCVGAAVAAVCSGEEGATPSPRARGGPRTSHAVAQGWSCEPGRCLVLVFICAYPRGAWGVRLGGRMGVETYSDLHTLQAPVQGVTLVNPFVFRPTLLSIAVARQCAETLYEHCEAALDAKKRCGHHGRAWPAAELLRTHAPALGRWHAAPSRCAHLLALGCLRAEPLEGSHFLALGRWRGAPLPGAHLFALLVQGNM